MGGGQVTGPARDPWNVSVITSLTTAWLGGGSLFHFMVSDYKSLEDGKII